MLIEEIEQQPNQDQDNIIEEKWTKFEKCIPVITKSSASKDRQKDRKTERQKERNKIIEDNK